MTARNIIWCRTCLMPSSRPRVVFDETGQCNACKHRDDRKLIDWDVRRKEFERLVDRMRRHQTYDILVPMSGGKDSATIAHKLKYEYGLNPLGVCYGQHIWTPVGQQNFKRIQEHIDIVYLCPNRDVQRKLARRWFIERGHHKNAYDSAVCCAPLWEALERNIPLVCFAEHGGSMYGDHILSEDHRRRRDFSEMAEIICGDDARNWAVDGITHKDLRMYTYPEFADIERAGVEAHYFGYYTDWDIYENARYARDKMGFETAWADDGYEIEIDGEIWRGRSDGDIVSYDSVDDAIDDADYHMMFVKHLFGRALRQAARLIQGGHMTREQGLSLVRKYDGEKPTRYMPEILEYLQMNQKEYDAIVDVHRNPELWAMENGQWKPRFTPR